MGDKNGLIDVYFVRDRGPLESWENYGADYPGTLGVPALTAQEAPVIGGPFTLEVANSAGRFTVAILRLGALQVDVPTGKGGHLFVDPTLSFLLSLTPVAPTPVVGGTPLEETTIGVHVYAQAIEIDAGAAGGLSFTEGIDLLPGN